MAAGKYVVVWPKVKVSVNGKNKILTAEDLLPSGVSDTDAALLLSIGAVAGVRTGKDAAAAAPAPTPTQGDTEKPFDPDVGGGVRETLAYVGDDQAKAAQQLELEQGKESPRSTLVEKLEGIIGTPAS